MKKAFKDVAKLDSLEDVGISRKACKLSEESGELMQVICRYVGMKSNQMTPAEMKEEAFGEVADVIQNCFCIANQFGLKEEDLNYVCPTLKTSNANIDFDFLSDEGIKFFVSVGKVVDVVHKYKNSAIPKELAQKKLKNRISKAIKNTLIIASILRIEHKDIENKILEKDKKWLLRIEKKKKK